MSTIPQMEILAIRKKSLGSAVFIAVLSDTIVIHDWVQAYCL